MRLSRGGSKKKPFYRVVVTDSRKKRDGQSIEIIGTYDPMKSEDNIKLNSERVQYWYSQGAQPTDTVRYLIFKLGIDLKAK